jgi:hypothetical protein
MNYDPTFTRGDPIFSETIRFIESNFRLTEGITKIRVEKGRLLSAFFSKISCKKRVRIFPTDEHEIFS